MRGLKGINDPCRVETLNNRIKRRDKLRRIHSNIKIKLQFQCQNIRDNFIVLIKLGIIGRYIADLW